MTCRDIEPRHSEIQVAVHRFRVAGSAAASDSFSQGRCGGGVFPCSTGSLAHFSLGSVSLSWSRLFVCSDHREQRPDDPRITQSERAQGPLLTVVQVRRVFRDGRGGDASICSSPG
jgi:hypothetical protein